MRILSYLCPCCGVFAARFSNLTTFECSHWRDALTFTHDILHNKCKRPQQTTQKISNLYNENIYHHLTLQQKFRYFLNKGVCVSLPQWIKVNQRSDPNCSKWLQIVFSLLWQTPFIWPCIAHIRFFLLIKYYLESRHEQWYLLLLFQ